MMSELATIWRTLECHTVEELSFWISEPPLAEMGYLQEEIDIPAKSGSIDRFQVETEIKK